MGVNRGQDARRVRDGHLRFGCRGGRGERGEPWREQECSDRVACREAQPVLAGGPLAVDGLGGPGERESASLASGYSAVPAAVGCTP